MTREESIESRWFLNKITYLLRKTNYHKINLSPAERLVLFAIAEFADAEGKSYALTSEIESVSGISAKNLHRHLIKLSDPNREIITIERKYYIFKGKKMVKNSYTINLKVILNITTNGEEEIKIDSVNIEPSVTVKDRSEIEPSVTMTELKPILKDIKQKNKHIYNVQDQNLTNIEQLCHDLHFEDFWACYPRKEKKSKARDIWIRERLDTIADEIIQDVRDRQVRHDRWEDRSFIPMPTTYLNQEGWKDEIIERRKLDRKSNGQAQGGNIRQYAHGLQRAQSELTNKYVRAIQDNLGRKVD